MIYTLAYSMQAKPSMNYNSMYAKVNNKLVIWFNSWWNKIDKKKNNLTFSIYNIAFDFAFVTTLLHLIALFQSIEILFYVPR